MATSNTDVRKYDIQYQLYLLQQIFSTPDLYVRCRNVLKPDYFDKEYHSSIQYVHDYSAKYNITPTLNDIKHNADFSYSETVVPDLNQQAVLDSVGEFCRHKALAQAIQQGMELVNQKRYGGILVIFAHSIKGLASAGKSRCTIFWYSFDAAVSCTS